MNLATDQLERKQRRDGKKIVFLLSTLVLLGEGLVVPLLDLSCTLCMLTFGLSIHGVHRGREMK
jgi:hypothetical protein